MRGQAVRAPGCSLASPRHRAARAVVVALELLIQCAKSVAARGIVAEHEQQAVELRGFFGGSAQGALAGEMRGEEEGGVGLFGGDAEAGVLSHGALSSA